MTNDVSALIVRARGKIAQARVRDQQLKQQEQNPNSVTVQFELDDAVALFDALLNDRDYCELMDRFDERAVEIAALRDELARARDAAILRMPADRQRIEKLLGLPVGEPNQQAAAREPVVDSLRALHAIIQRVAIDHVDLLRSDENAAWMEAGALLNEIEGRRG